MKNISREILILLCILVMLPIEVAQGGVLKDVYEILRDLEKQLEEDYDQEIADYKRKFEDWVNFSPSSHSGDAVFATLRPLDNIDLDSGDISGISYGGRKWDLVFVTGPGGEEVLRALDGVSWYEKGVASYKTLIYREVRDASYSAFRNQKSGYTDLFHRHRSNVPGKDYMFFVKTAEGNVAKLQIVGYENVMSGNQLVTRNMRIRYEVFPVKPDSPIPEPPKKLGKGLLGRIKDLY